MAQLIRRTAAATNPKNVTVIDNKAISPKPTLFRLIGKSPNRSRRNSFTSPGLTLAWPTHNGAVVQLARPSLTLRDYVMRLPTTLTLPSTTSQTKRDTARNSRLMISQSTLTSRHRPHPCLAQNFRREGQLSSRVLSKTFAFIIFRSRAEGIPVTSNSI